MGGPQLFGHLEAVRVDIHRNDRCTAANDAPKTACIPTVPTPNMAMEVPGLA